MSDIFISYAKADYALALKLSAFLEAEGWSVWWDKSLGVADLYRDEIMKQLAAARAVITIWTASSVRSDWVRAEAGRAKAEGKLIPVKTADVAYADIPLPFGEMHTENVGSTEFIRAAVISQLSKPTLQGSSFRQISNSFRYQVLTWIGIVGTVITLFANLNGVLILADWAGELASHWHELTQTFWELVFDLLKVKVPKEFVPIISFIVSVGILVVGVNLSVQIAKTPDNMQKAMPFRRGIRLLFRGIIFYVLAMLAIGLLVELPVDLITEKSPFWLRMSLQSLVLLLVFVGVPFAYLLYIAEERSWLVVNSLLFLFMSYCLLIAPTSSLFEHSFGEDPSGAARKLIPGMLSAVTLLQICWMAVILFSPVRQLTRRLGFVVLGVLTLVGLSEISKLNLHQYLQPPKMSASPRSSDLASALRLGRGISCSCRSRHVDHQSALTGPLQAMT
jgi:hypothetical protein